MQNADLIVPFVGGGGALGLVLSVALPITRRFLEGRLRSLDRRSEIEIKAVDREAEARADGLRQETAAKADAVRQESAARIALLDSQRRTVERVAETMERLAVSYELIAEHTASVNRRLDRIEDNIRAITQHYGLEDRISAETPPIPLPRRSAPSDAHQ